MKNKLLSVVFLSGLLSLTACSELGFEQKSKDLRTEALYLPEMSNYALNDNFFFLAG